MLGTILGVAGAAGNLLGALGKGKGKGPTRVSGFASQPGEISDYALDELFPRIKAFGNKKYQGLPKRRVNAEDMDPLFGSKSRQDLQRYKDEMLALNAAPVSTPDESGSNMGLSNLGRIIAMQQMPDYWDDFSDDQYAAIGKAVQDGYQPRGGMLFDYKNKKPLTLYDIKAM